MMKNSPIQSELNSAKSGDMSPLLARLKSGYDISKAGPDPTKDYEPAEDQTYAAVQSAYQEGELTDAQFDQCLAAIGAE